MDNRTCYDALIMTISLFFLRAATLWTPAFATVIAIVFAFPTLAAPPTKNYGPPTPVVMTTTANNAERLKKIAPHVATELPDSAFIIAVAGNTPGNGGTHFRSEVTVVNNRNIPQRIEFFYMPAGVGCAGIRSAAFTFEPNYWFTWFDFVTDVFNVTGIGSIVAFAVDERGNYDSNGNIDGFARIWTPVPGFRGTASQSFPPVTFSPYPYGQGAMGLRQDANFRTNLAILNYLPDNPNMSRVFDVWVGGATGLVREYTVSVPPCSLVLQGIPSGDYGPLYLWAEPRDAFGGWYGFGSTVDNLSGDNWSSAMRP